MADVSNKMSITPLPEPDRNDWVSRNGQLSRPDPKDFALRVGIDPSYELSQRSTNAVAAPDSGSQARTLYYAEDLGRHCRKLEREARLAIEETGANMLYLVLGFLEYPESPDSQKRYLAPLVCIPVSMTRTDKGQYSSFYLNYTGEELTENLSLREKVKRDFGLNLPEYDTEADSPVETYLDKVSDDISKLPEWHVRRMMTVALLSFTNMLLVRDLDPDNWPNDGKESALLTHPLVKQVFEGRPSSGEMQYAGERSIDNYSQGEFPLIYDADSSQHNALIDILEGQNRVIEGPPGTGKSQTITNLIAAALQKGKKVLFLAEKLAALEVVKNKLDQAGLSPFVLELHSNKTNKKRVLEDLKTRIRLCVSTAKGLPALLEQQEQKRRELKAYADLMNTKVGNQLELTLHQTMWRAELNRMRCGECAAAVQDIDYFVAPRTTPTQFAALCDQLRHLAEHLAPIGTYGPAHPLWGFFPEEFKPEDDLPVQHVLNTFAAKFDAFSVSVSKAAELLGNASMAMSASNADQLVSVLSDIAPEHPEDVAFKLLPRLFPESDPSGTQTRIHLQMLAERARTLAAQEGEVSGSLRTKTPASHELAMRAQHALGRLQAYGLAQLTAPRLINLRETLAQAIEKAHQALNALRDIAPSASLSFDGSAKGVLQLQAVMSAASSAPRDFLQLRHAGLRGATAVATLTSARQQFRKIVDQRKTLGAEFYMDDLPEDEVLGTAIHTLREGDAWYRFLQKRWRQAVQVHHRLQRQKSKAPAANRLRELEQLQQLRRDETAWLANSALAAAAGSHFRGEDTPLDDLLLVAHWVAETDAVFEEAQLPSSAFDAISIDRSVLNRLRGHATAVEQASAALSALDALFNDFTSAAPSAVKLFSTPNWDNRLFVARAVVAAMTEAEDILGKYVLQDVAADIGLNALRVSAELPLMEAELQADGNGLALFGDAYAGRHSNFECALAAHAYGTMVKRAGLTASIERLLISPDCMETHGLLCRYVESIGHGWEAVQEFSDEMSKFGRFDAGAWADPSGLTTAQYAAGLASKTRMAADRIGGLMSWVQYVEARAEVTAGLESFVTRLESGAIPPDKLEIAFKYRFHATVAQSVFEKSVALRQFSGLRHSAVRNEYAELDRKIIKLRGSQVAQDCHRLSRWLPGTTGIRVQEKTEMALLEHLMPQKKPRVPVRQMLRKAGRTIQELKPCFMMGPQAVAQFLEPGQLRFDIIVMDEASQLRPEQAIGAIARGAQLVVVGDPKQLPPTSFFSRMGATDDDGGDELGQVAASQAESILDVCISHFQPVRTLRWHYRSRHESLIAFSNQNFYGGNLVVFPSPYPKSKALGLRYQYVADGVYENQTNQIEARRVIDAVVEHILHRPDDSLGIVTLNIKQRDLVAEMVEERLRSLPEAVAYREHWEASGMGLFIKNLENVQGDERDCILISTTFGKPKGADVVRQNFGPISRDGGWRRLNVLFTRARKSVAVFSSMRPEDIVVDSKTPEGTRALRNYLKYARDGSLPMERKTGLPPDSDFEIAVMDVLRGKGYEVEPQLGVAGFRFDLGVKHPDHQSGYLAAIECDGATYHSGVSVRDRDRIRQEILESLGWKGRIWRIWSTDWFRNPFAETQRMVDFLESLKRQPIPDEYQSDLTTEDSPDVPPISVATPALTAETLILEDDKEDLEIEVGDLVTYAPATSPAEVRQIQLTAKQTNLELGLVAESTPLGQVLLGATVGDTVVLRVPGKDPQPFVVQRVKRAAASTAP